MIDRPVAKHLEILGGMLLLCVRIVEGVKQTGALDRCLYCSIHAGGFGEPSCLKNGWRNINDVSNLGAQSALLFDTVWPMNNHAVTGPTKV